MTYESSSQVSQTLPTFSAADCLGIIDTGFDYIPNMTLSLLCIGSLSALIPKLKAAIKYERILFDCTIAPRWIMLLKSFLI